MKAYMVTGNVVVAGSSQGTQVEFKTVSSGTFWSQPDPGFIVEGAILAMQEARNVMNTPGGRGCLNGVDDWSVVAFTIWGISDAETGKMVVLHHEIYNHSTGLRQVQG